MTNMSSLYLVTGVPGWLGSSLVSFLLQHPLVDSEKLTLSSNPSVRCLIQPGSDLSDIRSVSGQVEFVEGDLLDRGSLRKFCNDADGSTLFHCAGMIHPKRRAAEFNQINVVGTSNLLSAAEAAGIRRAVVVSSNSPTGTTSDRTCVLDETAPYKPYMGYGSSKMLMEQLVEEYQARGKLETVIIRPPWFYGPNQPKRQSKFFDLIRLGLVPVIGNGENARSMVYIDNLCQGLVLAQSVERANGQIYWIADSRAYTMNEIVETIERLLESEFGFRVAHRRLRLPNFLGECLTVLDALTQRFGVYVQTLHVMGELNKTIACSTAKAEKELGYAPEISLEEGMRRSIDWSIKSGQLK